MTGLNLVSSNHCSSLSDLWEYLRGEGSNSRLNLTPFSYGKILGNKQRPRNPLLSAKTQVKRRASLEMLLPMANYNALFHFHHHITLLLCYLIKGYIRYGAVNE
jgi:hypothetical protein